MFEKSEIKLATAAAALDAGLSKSQQNYIIAATSKSRFMPAAVAGLREGVIGDAGTASAYLCAAIIDSASRSGDPGGRDRSEVAMQVAFSAMINAGATCGEAPVLVNELIEMHRQDSGAGTARVEMDGFPIRRRNSGRPQGYGTNLR